MFLLGGIQHPYATPSQPDRVGTRILDLDDHSWWRSFGGTVILEKRRICLTRFETALRVGFVEFEFPGDGRDHAEPSG